MDTSLFIDIIESVKGVTFIRNELKDGIHVRFYDGLTGKSVMIDTTDEEITDEICKAHLFKLGIEHLIPSLFHKN